MNITRLNRFGVHLLTGLMAGAALQTVAMPTQAEAEAARPAVKRMLASDWAAMKSGKKTQTEVADAAMKLAGEAESDAAKLLLIKAAFTLYVKDGKIDQAVSAINSLERTIADMPSQIISNMIETALLGIPKKDCEQFYQLHAGKKPMHRILPARRLDSRSVAAVQRVANDRLMVKSIIDGMIMVPGRDYFLLKTEVTQGQWESVMEENLSMHKGVNLPVECVSRDDCDVFIKKLNETEEARMAQLEFYLPTPEEWEYAAHGGGQGDEFWVKPGVPGNIPDMAWTAENSSTQTCQVATKAPNAFGFYDMLGNVSEWVATTDPDYSKGWRRGGCMAEPAQLCIKRANHNWGTPKNWRKDFYGIRVAAHKRGDGSMCGVQLWKDGPYWAECNIGAKKPEDSGYYFNWGDTVGYKQVTNVWSAVDGSRTGFKFTKNNCPTVDKDDKTLQLLGYIDTKGKLVPEHDAATAHLGAPWRLPTVEDFVALTNNCDRISCTHNGVTGMKIKGRGEFESCSIFLPAASFGEALPAYVGRSGYYWLASPISDKLELAWSIGINSRGKIWQNTGSRRSGLPVRAVRDPH